MERFNLRWERIIESNLSFDDIKILIKKIWKYEIKEECLGVFINNINKYTDIDEGVLLSYIEPNSYRKLIVYDMKDTSKFDIHPINSNLTTMNKLYFKQINRINMKPKEWYFGELDSTYKIVYYDDTDDNTFEIRLACVKEYYIKEIDEDGEQTEIPKEVYDSIKIIINFENRKVFLFYNDIQCSREHDKDIRHRKIDFSNHFYGEVNNSNLIKYNISSELTRYTLEYIKEIENKEYKKLVSLIEVSGIKKKNSKVKSSEPDFTHNMKTLEGIKEKLATKLYRVSILECKINNSLMKFKHDGEIHLYDCTFQSEVVENVSKEIFYGSNLFK